MAKPFVYKCTLDRVVDGDTCDVNLDLGFSIILAKQRIRLVFVLESQGRGKYGRILGVLWDFDGNSINQKLVDAGLAVEYWGGTKVKVWGAY